MTGAALVSAAAIVTASPAFVPTHDLAVGAPSPLPLSTAQYELTAITDITIQGINDAYWFGWGGYITDTNTYYPGVSDVYVAGAPGVLYYLVDNAVESFLPGFDLDNYYFEIGAPSIPYVGAGELFGTGSPIFQAAQTVFYYGVPNVVNSIVASATQLFPKFSVGPVELGGGILASLFFYGQTPDYTPPTTTTPGTGFSYSTNGLSAIFAYISTSISDNLPSAAALTSLSGAGAAAAAAISTVVKDVEGAIKSAVQPASTPAAAKSSSKAAAAIEAKPEAEGTPASEGTPSTDGSSTDSPSTDGSSTESPSTGSTSTGVASSAKPATTAPKPAKPAKPANPLNKIGKQISDALGITKKPKPSTSSSSSSSDSSSAGSSDSGSSSSGSAGSAK